MPNGYIIARIDVTDPQAYEQYRLANAVPFAKYKAKFLVRGGNATVKEGTGRSRNVVIEFDSYATALACYESPEYAAAIALRKDASEGDIVVVEGYDGPQPA